MVIHAQTVEIMIYENLTFIILIKEIELDY